MNIRKITKRSFLISKLTFLSGSWLMYLLLKCEKLDYSVNQFWRDINEFSLYVFVVFFIIELFIKDQWQILLSVICIITTIVLSQSVGA